MYAFDSNDVNMTCMMTINRFRKFPTTSETLSIQRFYQDFFKENVRYPVCTCRDPISLILENRFSLVLGTR